MSNFSEEIIEQVWQKATIDPENNPSIWRKDYWGAWIGRQYYGNRDSQYGWEIDHITAVTNDGSDILSNLRPLQWMNNASKQDGRLIKSVIANGINNIKVNN